LLVIAHTINVPALNVQAIVDGVWNEPVAGHTTPGTFGEEVQTPSLNPSQVASAVWDATLASYQTSGSTGEALGNAAKGSGAAVNLIATIDPEVEFDVEVNPDPEITTSNT
jgi:hypothetical protein